MRTQQAFTRVHSSSFLQGIIRSSLFIRAASLFTTDKEIIDDQTRIMRAPRKGVEPTDLLAVLQGALPLQASSDASRRQIQHPNGHPGRGKQIQRRGGARESMPPPFSRTSFKSKSKLVANGFTVNSRTNTLLSNKSSRQSVHQAHQAKTGTAEGKRLVHHGQCALLCQSRPCVLLSRLGFQKSWPPVLPEFGLLSSTGDV